MHNPIQKVSLLYYEALASLGSARNWLPLFIFWVIQALLLTAVTRAPELPGGGAVMDVLRAAFDEEAGEYPRFYLILPDVHRRLYLILAAFLGIYCQGVSLLYLLRHHTGGKLMRARPWRRALRRWPGLFLINLVSMVFFLGPLLVVRQWVLPALGASGGGKAAYLAGYGLGFVAEIFLLYAAFLYVSFSSGWWTSLVASVRFALGRFGVSLILVLIPFFLALPLQGFFAHRQQVAYEFRPELIYHLLLFSSFVTLLVLFVQLSTLVRFYAEEELRRPFEGEWDDKHEAKRTYGEIPE